MTVRECYELIGADYDKVLGWLVDDSFIEKFIKKFAVSNYYQPIETALNEDDYESAFKNVHSLKGVAANLGLDKLFEVSSELCEELRHGKPDKDVSGMLENIRKEHDRIIEFVRNLD